MRNSLTNTVQAKRRDIGMTQVELAEKIGVTRQTIISIEKGNYVPSVALALRIAKTFSVSVESLFTENSSK